MAIVSGNIGQLIPFNVEQAGTVTGVYFGSGLSENISAQPNNTTILAKVPDDANWDFVTFYKRPRTSTYDVSETGYKQTGAFSGLNSKVVASGFDPKCTSGTVAYSNALSHVAICNLNATGTTEPLASGALYNAYGSGYCGDVGSYTDSGYSESHTRLNDFNTFEGQDGNWLAIGVVEDTGNFVWQKASVDVSCTLPVSESTSFKFVPIPLITSFSPKEGGKNDPLNIYGKALHDVSIVSINNSGVVFQAVSNTHLSGAVPSGTFNHEIQTVGPSGVKSQSVENFVSLISTPPTAAAKVLSLRNGQFIKREKGSPPPVSIAGENITGLSTASLTDEKNNTTNLLNDSSFSYTATALSVPVSGLDEGLYDVSLQGTYGAASLNDVISIIGSPTLTQKYVSFLSTTNFINEPALYNSLSSLEVAKYNSQYPFSLSKEPDRICLTIKNSGINTAREGSFSLAYDYGNVNFNSIDTYHITATGETIPESAANALSMYNSGIYTIDEFGDPYDSFSYKIQPCICDAFSSGITYISSTPSFYNSGIITGLITGVTGNHPKIVPIKALCVNDYDVHASQNPKQSCAQNGFVYGTEILSSGNFPNIKLTATGYTTGITSGDIVQQLAAYPDYKIINWEHAYVTHREPNVYKSGISYPFLTSLFTSYSYDIWENIRLSGMSELYPNGYPGGDNLTTSYGYTNSSTYGFNTKLSGVGKNEEQAKALVINQMDQHYSQCQTGNYSTSFVTGIETPAYTGITYGYC